MAHSIVFSLPAALRTLLEARLVTDALDGTVLTGPRLLAAGTDGVAIQDVRASTGRPITGGYRREEGTVVCRVYCEVTGAGEDAIDDARERADLYVDAISTAIDPTAGDNTIGGTVRFCDITEIAEDDQTVTDQPPGHSFACRVTISFTADVQPGA
jgi:hypothetical protein